MDALQYYIYIYVRTNAYLIYIILQVIQYTFVKYNGKLLFSYIAILQNFHLTDISTHAVYLSAKLMMTPQPVT